MSCCVCVINVCILVPACSVSCRLVYSLLPGVPVCQPCPALMSLKTFIWVYVLVCVFLFPPRVCTVTVKLCIFYLCIAVFRSIYAKIWIYEANRLLNIYICLNEPLYDFKEMSQVMYVTLVPRGNETLRPETQSGIHPVESSGREPNWIL